MPCVKHTNSGLALDGLFSSRTGISGSVAPLAPHMTNTTSKTRPDTKMLMTLGESQRNTTRQDRGSAERRSSCS